ncbi:MAG TPA: Lrp/AsnC family transcriptional regulator [Candidatus Woesearchaeota archaeon]|nr:Lrp/AsnC family transcriptional regulator [Candidatus Woesearchaeota archaeon]
MAYAINDKALSLLLHLREDSRRKLTEISKKTRIPVSTLFDMLKMLQDGVIKKNTILLDFNALGYSAHACILIKAGKNGKETLRRHLLVHPNVNSVFKINNDWDFLIETVHKNLKDLDEFVDDIERHGIEQKKIHYLIDEIKKEGFNFC